MGKALTKKILIEYLSTSGPVMNAVLVACALGLLFYILYSRSSDSQLQYGTDCEEV
jgi:hypothetical protein